MASCGFPLDGQAHLPSSTNTIFTLSPVALCTHRRSQFRRGDVCFRQFYFLLYRTPHISLFQAAHLGTLPSNCRQGLVWVWFFAERVPASSVACQLFLARHSRCLLESRTAPLGKAVEFLKGQKSQESCFLSLRSHPQRYMFSECLNTRKFCVLSLPTK